MTRAHVFARSAAASAAVALVMLTGRAIAGCAGAQRPDPLVTASRLSNDAAAEIDAHTKRHEAALTAAILAGAAACPHEPRASVAACQQQAAIAAQQVAAPEHTRLLDAAMLQVTVARGLATAQECRRSGASCEAEQLRLIEGVLAELGAVLRQLGATPPPPAPAGSAQ